MVSLWIVLDLVSPDAYAISTAFVQAHSEVMGSDCGHCFQTNFQPSLPVSGTQRSTKYEDIVTPCFWLCWQRMFFSNTPKLCCVTKLHVFPHIQLFFSSRLWWISVTFRSTSLCHAADDGSNGAGCVDWYYRMGVDFLALFFYKTVHHICSGFSGSNCSRFSPQWVAVVLPQTSVADGPRLWLPFHHHPPHDYPRHHKDSGLLILLIKIAATLSPYVWGVWAWSHNYTHQCYSIWQCCAAAHHAQPHCPKCEVQMSQIQP